MAARAAAEALKTRTAVLADRPKRLAAAAAACTAMAELGDILVTEVATGRYPHRISVAVHQMCALCSDGSRPQRELHVLWRFADL